MAACCLRLPWSLSPSHDPSLLSLPKLVLFAPPIRLPSFSCHHISPRQFISRSPQAVTGWTATVCFTSLTALALSGARQAFALGDVGEASTDFGFAASPEVMYAIFAIEAIALIGAAVGGTLARQRKEELERLNAQLRKINEYLRSKAMIESYAPGLVYAPVGRPVDDKAVDSEKELLVRVLKAGKKFLRERKPHLAYEEFKKGLSLAQQMGDPIEEKKAARGVGASCQRQGIFREAIKYHALVLEISERTGLNCGNTEALGSIADCYCELGDLDAAQRYYNQYIDRLATDEG